MTISPSNASIKHLALDHSALKLEQLKNQSGMDQLEILSLAGIRLDGRDIEWLVKTFPNLRTLTCEPAIQRLRLEDVANLETIFSSNQNSNQNSPQASFRGYTYRLLDALKIVNAPKLRERFDSQVPMLLLHIESAPSLRGLSFQSPLPAKAVCKG